MKIGEKEVVIKDVYTRGIDKEFNKILFNWAKTTTVDWKPNFDIPPMNIQDANDYIVKAMTNLTDEEVANLSLDDYSTILEKVSEIKNGGKSKGKN